MLIDLAPRKRGSLEDWMIAMVREAAHRGHRIDVFGMEPIQPEIRLELERLGARWTPIESLQASWVRGISTLRQYDVIQINMFASRHPISLMAYAAWPAAVLFVDHCSIRLPDLGRGTSLKNRLLNPLIRARVSKVVGVSNFVRDRATVEMHLRQRNAVTIYNGVDLHRFAPVAGSQAETFQVICVAHLIPEKGVEVAIRALALLSLPQYRLLIVGDGPNRDLLERLAEDLGVQKHVAFVGLRDDVHLLLRESHVFVHPAIWSEAFGLTITEAMASGCPIVASRVGAIPELVNHEEDGLLVRPGDPNELAGALRLLHDDPDLAGRLAKNARRRVELKFSLERCVQDHIDLIERAAAENR
jgi:glycosyltransferase involved in cell wall biosynthesis